MSRIALGVIGDAGGHISQALGLVQSLPGHEFLFLGSDRGTRLAELGYAVAEIPTFETCYRNNRVDIVTTVKKGLHTIVATNRIVESVVKIMKDFKPDLVFTAYEHSVGLAAHKLGVPVISIDNHHFLTKCKCHLPKGQMLSRWAYELPLRYFFSNADYFLISAFYRLEPMNPSDTWVFPPVLRRMVREITPTDGDHVLVYQTSSSFRIIERLLEQMPGRFVLYGLGERPSRGNLEYKTSSSVGFLSDLASARYVITNGGHNVMAEALHYGKPVLSFPINFAYEQFFNAHMLRSLGYGDYCLSTSPDSTLLTGFERRLNQFRAAISGREFCGNDEIAARVEEFL